MQNDEVQKLAEKIAQVISSESKPNDLKALQASIEALASRLDRIENRKSNFKFETLNPRSDISNFKSVISDLKSTHPSLDKLNIAEAIADGIFGNYQKEKACQFEPDKPCDHCSMCSSRGF